MNKWCSSLALGVGLLVGLLAFGQVAAQTADDQLLTKDNAITGTYVEGSPKLAAKDIYKLNISVGDTTEYYGTITRQPDLFTRVIRSQKQKGQLEYNVNLAVRNPRNTSERLVVGKWVGTVPIVSATGLYDIVNEVKVPTSRLTCG